jgi:magnesium-transporting ATPase (P-type)
VEKGRIIYSGIQLFVAFIMSVHIGEVIQIFFCVVFGCPIMRTPLQILFLILVTDLPPAVALGMEPGDPNILKERPRPKTQPIILMWMWQSIIVNGMILSISIIVTYLIALRHYVAPVAYNMGYDISDDIVDERKVFKDCQDGKNGFEKKRSEEECYDKLDMDDGPSANLRRARTAAFIAVVWAENIRAYCSRSFTRPIFIHMFQNMAMQKAICIAEIALVFVVFFLPLVGLEDIMGLDAFKILTLEGFGLALLGPILTVIGCEFYKLVSKGQIKAYADRVRRQLELEEKARLEAFAHVQTAYVQDVEEPTPNQTAPPQMAGTDGK